MFGHGRIIVWLVRTRMEGLGRRLVAYLVMLVAVMILLRIVLGAVIGFIHTLIFIALLVFALYAFIWARASSVDSHAAGVDADQRAGEHQPRGLGTRYPQQQAAERQLDADGEDVEHADRLDRQAGQPDGP